MSSVRLGVEVAERIVRERREMDDRVEAREVGRRDVADVGDRALDALRLGAEVAAAVEARVEPDDVVPGVGEVAARAPSRCSRGDL